MNIIYWVPRIKNRIELEVGKMKKYISWGQFHKLVCALFQTVCALGPTVENLGGPGPWYFGNITLIGTLPTLSLHSQYS